MRITKFGGTSLQDAARIKELLHIIDHKEPQFLVLSAMGGTTNSLVEILHLGASQQTKQAIEKLTQLHDRFKETSHQLLSEDFRNIPFIEKLAYRFHDIRQTLLLNKNYPAVVRNRILAQGELITSELVYQYFQQEEINCYLLPATELIYTNGNGEPCENKIRWHLQEAVRTHPGYTIYITQGFICTNSNGEIDNLKRGGSDYTASLLGAAIQADEIQIWTDIDGMHNNDPRYVPDTHPIHQLSYDEASELAYFGAKIMHPQSLFPAQKNGIPVQIKNTFDPDALGTLINDQRIPDTYKAVAAKAGISTIKIKSARMLMAYGFLRKVFEIFENHQTPIDMITTSEVAISLTVDRPNALKAICHELDQLGEVECHANQSIVCIVGDFKEQSTAQAQMVLSALQHIPIGMISYGASQNNISVLIHSDYHTAALNALQKGLFDHANAPFQNIL